MSTVKKPLKYIWVANFEDGHQIVQPANDHYSKHDDNAEWNPSAFRDILDYEKHSRLEEFFLTGFGEKYEVNLLNGKFKVNKKEINRGESRIPRKLIYYREVEQKFIDGIAQEPEVVEYCMGYEFKDKNGKTVKRIIKIDGK